MHKSRYASMTALEMAQCVRQRTTSPVELAQAAIEAIRCTDGALNAYSEVFEREAIERAQQLEGEAERGRLRGPLHGVPVAIKDLFNIEGTRTRRGSRLYADAVSANTAPSVERLIAAGAVVVGKNTTPELGWKASSNSPLYGVTRNPWDPSRTTGGSSSGSGAAVAAGTVPIAMGSDGGGSMRIPASFCGIFSLKAHLGRVPTHPLSSSEQLSHAGPMTNSVADYALALDVVAGPHPRDPNSLPESPRGFLARLESPRAFRVAFAPTLFGREVSPEVARAVQGAVDGMKAVPGISICEVAPGWPDPIGTFEALWVARGALYLDLPDEAKQRLDPGFARLIGRAARLGAGDHLRALQKRAEFCLSVAEWFEGFDVLLLPMVPIEPFAAEADGPENMDPDRSVPWAHWTPFSHPFNLTGQPAASIPCGWTASGHPVGLQVVGRRFDDLGVLQFCRLFERRFDWRARRPRVHAAA